MSRSFVYDRSSAPSPEPNPDGPLPNPPRRSENVRSAFDKRVNYEWLAQRKDVMKAYG